VYRYSMTQWIVGNEDLEDTFRRLKKYGYDAIELDAEPYTADQDRCLRLMRQYKIGALSMCGIYGPDRDLTADGDNGRKAVRYLCDSADFASKVGAAILIVVPAPVGRISRPEGRTFRQMWDNAVHNISEAADYAVDLNVTLAVEAINRYETGFINCLSKAKWLVGDINRPNVGIMADTFHMAMEERNIGASLRMVADKLVHVHIADNTREPPGYGSTDFKEILSVLRDIGYKGSLTMEYVCRFADPYKSDGYLAKKRQTNESAKQAIEYMKRVERAVYAP
jgi:D-psicose/D-tagatose/L-ribulose 3-epimerase